MFRTFRYNWLRRLGYKTVTGTNCFDGDFGDEWVELVMQKNGRIKHATLPDITIRQVLDMERR